MALWRLTQRVAVVLLHLALKLDCIAFSSHGMARINGSKALARLPILGNILADLVSEFAKRLPMALLQMGFRILAVRFFGNAERRNFDTFIGL